MRAVVNVALSPLKNRKGVKLVNGDDDYHHHHHHHHHHHQVDPAQKQFQFSLFEGKPPSPKSSPPAEPPYHSEAKHPCVGGSARLHPRTGSLNSSWTQTRRASIGGWGELHFQHTNATSTSSTPSNLSRYASTPAIFDDCPRTGSLNSSRTQTRRASTGGGGDLHFQQTNGCTASASSHRSRDASTPAIFDDCPRTGSLNSSRTQNRRASTGGGGDLHFQQTNATSTSSTPSNLSRYASTPAIFDDCPRTGSLNSSRTQNRRASTGGGGDLHFQQTNACTASASLHQSRDTSTPAIFDNCPRTESLNSPRTQTRRASTGGAGDLHFSQTNARTSSASSHRSRYASSPANFDIDVAPPANWAKRISSGVVERSSEGLRPSSKWSSSSFSAARERAWSPRVVAPRPKVGSPMCCHAPPVLLDDEHVHQCPESNNSGSASSQQPQRQQQKRGGGGSLKSPTPISGRLRSSSSATSPQSASEPMHYSHHEYPENKVTYESSLVSPVKPSQQQQQRPRHHHTSSNSNESSSHRRSVTRSPTTRNSKNNNRNAEQSWASFDQHQQSQEFDPRDFRPSLPVRTRTMEDLVMDPTERCHPPERIDLEGFYDLGGGDYMESSGYDDVDEGGIVMYEPNGKISGECDDFVINQDEDYCEIHCHEQANVANEEEFQNSTTFPPAVTQKPSRLYEFARRCLWDKVLQQCQEHARDASYVCPKDGTTALHLAVMSRCNPLLRNGELPGYKPAPRLIVEALLVACPEAAITRCSLKKYTPLTYACLVTDDGFDMSDAADLVVTILRHAPQSAYVFTDDGFSALDVHIMSYSRLHGHKEEVYSGGRTSTVVLRTLLEEKPLLADARTYRNKIRGPLELLYRCNMEEFKDAVDGGHPHHKPDKVSSVASTLSEWWAWKWALLLIKHASKSAEDSASGPFCAVHGAARIVGCPIPILSLAISMDPEQVKVRDPRDDLYNMPLHEVASWRCDSEIICGDPFVIRRKVRAIELFLEEYPIAARTTNNMGETPLQLAIEAGTPWHGGTEMLVRACPKALKFPRKLRNRPDANRLGISVSLHSDMMSVDSEDEDPVEAIGGMYPFMVAAVLSVVPENQRRDPSFFFEDQSPEEHRQNLAKKDLESVRTIFGLLRARPEALARYINDISRKRREKRRASRRR